MIRPAKFFDTVRIVDLMHEMHENSRYRDVDEIDDRYTHKLVSQCIQRHGFTNDGGALVMVAVRDQRVEGFMIGILDRVYHIGKKLAANDLFLYCSPKAHPTDFRKLFDAYVSWAMNNPKVAEIKASWTDAVPGAERIEGVYEARGFRYCGGIWTREGGEDLSGRALAAFEGVQ